MTGPIPRRIAVWALAIIFSANFLSYLDRQLVSAFEGPLRRDLGLSPSQFGLLWTLFTLGYMVCAVPIGFLADRARRPRILAACIIVWSAATILSGAAQAHSVLYAARFFIGVGEAGCLIIGQALVVDFFSREVRGKALSVFHLGLPLGGTAAFILAGLLDQVVSWRVLFYAAGAPGLPVALLLWSLRDPPRGGGEGIPTAGKTGLAQYVELLRTPTLMLVIVAQAFAVFMIVPLIHFGAEFFIQERGMSAGTAKVAMGMMALVSGALGSFLGGVLGDRWSRRAKGGYALLAGLGFLAGFPSLLIGFHIQERWVFLPALTAGSFFFFLCMPAVNAQIANVTHPAQRAMAWSLAVFVLHLLGDTLAPWLFGTMDEAVGRLLAYTWFSGALALAGICCLIASRTASRDLERLRVRMEAAQKPASRVI
ncbi:MAG: MFS transporter [Planctomycetes bacterium]|nr:MFS transporter [Planctomycetota bacterium]